MLMPISAINDSLTKCMNVKALCGSLNKLISKQSIVASNRRAIKAVKNRFLLDTMFFWPSVARNESEQIRFGLVV